MNIPIFEIVPLKLLICVFLFMVMDIIVGVIKALSVASFKSVKMREGLYHKLGEMLAVIFGGMCELAFPIIGIDIKIPIVTSICIYIVVMETGSIVENLAEISPNLKKVLNKVFGGYKEEENEEEVVDE